MKTTKYYTIIILVFFVIRYLNNWVDGRVDWNLALDKKGAPSWVKNWCIAPVIVDPEKDEVYLIPLHYTMAHFSKYIYPGAIRIGLEDSDPSLLTTATRNPDGSIAVVVFNESNEEKTIDLSLSSKSTILTISAKAI